MRPALHSQPIWNAPFRQEGNLQLCWLGQTSQCPAPSCRLRDTCLPSALCLCKTLGRRRSPCPLRTLPTIKWPRPWLKSARLWEGRPGSALWQKGKGKSKTLQCCPVQNPTAAIAERNRAHWHFFHHGRNFLPRSETYLPLSLSLSRSLPLETCLSQTFHAQQLPWEPPGLLSQGEGLRTLLDLLAAGRGGGASYQETGFTVGHQKGGKRMDIWSCRVRFSPRQSTRLNTGLVSQRLSKPWTITPRDS